MNLSLDEYRALVAKAFRGVGYPWGLTEDASWAARRLAEFDATSPEVVVALLESLDAGKVDPQDRVRSRMPADDWTCAADALCPICVGTTILDLGPSALTDPLSLGPTLAPTLLASFLAELMGSDPITATWESGSCAISSKGVRFDGDRPFLAQWVTVAVLRGSDPTAVEQAAVELAGVGQGVHGRVILEPQLMQRLQGFAHRTYAPATEASRAGAGADSTDND